MAHAFDNRNFISKKQQTLHSVTPPLSSRCEIKNDSWERSSSPQLSSKSNHLPPSYEETVFPQALIHHPNSKSSSNDSSYRQRQQPVTGKSHVYLP
jgi:hypothetical protein